MIRSRRRTTGDRGFARRASVLGLGQSAVKGGQLVATVLLVRLLDPAEWTTTALVLSVHLAAVTMGTLNLQHGIIFFLPRLPAHRHRALVSQTAGVLLAAASVVGACVLIAAFAASSPDARPALVLVAITLVFELPASCAPVALLASGRIVGAATWDVSTTVVLLAAVGVPAALGLGTTGVACGLLVSAIARSVAFVAVLRCAFTGALVGLPAGTLRAQLAYGLPLGLTIATSVLSRSMDKWFIAAFAHSELGVYAVAAQEVPLLAVVPYAGGAAIATALVDAFHHGDLERGRRLWIGLTAAMSSIVVPLSVVLILVAPLVLPPIFGDEYAAGVVPFQLFSAITMHRVAEYGLVLRAADRTGDALRASVVLLGSNVVLAGLGAYFAGMVGAAGGTLVANAVAWVFVLGRLGRIFGVPVREVFAWREWCTAIGVSVPAALFAHVLTSALTTGAAGVLLEVLVFGTVVVAVLRPRRSPVGEQERDPDGPPAPVDVGVAA